MSPQGKTLLEWSAEARWNAAIIHLRLSGTMRESRRIQEAIVNRRSGGPEMAARMKPAEIRKEPAAAPLPVTMGDTPAPRFAVVAIRGRTRAILIDDLPLDVGVGLKEMLSRNSGQERIALAMHFAGTP